MLTIRYFLAALCIGFFPVVFGQLELSTARVKVIFSDETFEPYAQEIARFSEEALDILEPLFGQPKHTIVVNLEDTTDSYNAFAIQLPRPNMRLRALFPTDAGLSLKAENDLFLLIIHELTHLTQLAYTETVDGSGGLALGLVGEEVASIPPPWFVEGIATYIESGYTEGGRLDSAETRGIWQTMASNDAWPEFTEISLGTYSDWPAGAARYLFGSGFVDYLVENYGFDAIINTLKQYNSGLIPRTFSEAWFVANQTDLEEEWQAWYKEVLEQVQTRAFAEEKVLTDSGFYTGSIALHPEGKQVAWISRFSTLKIAEISGGELKDVRTIIERTAARSLEWLDDSTLIYHRIYRQPESSLSELFSLNVDTGVEEKLSSGARAFFPNTTPEKCILYVKDSVLQGSSLIEWCDGNETVIYQLDNKAHIVGLDVSQEGQIALSIWRNGFVDLAILANGQLNFLTADKALDLSPSWEGEKALLFHSDRGEVFNLYKLEVASKRLTQLSNVLGGAYEPVQTPSGLLYASLNVRGFDLAVLDSILDVEISLSSSGLEKFEIPKALVEVEKYNPLPSLIKPYGWYPSYFDYSLIPLELGIGASLVGQDDSGEHSYAINLAYDTNLQGHLSGVSSNLDYGFQDNVDPARYINYPFGVQFKAGIWQHYPHLQSSTETAFGVRAQVRTSQPFDKWAFYSLSRLGLVHLSSNDAWHLEGLIAATISQRSADNWGYVRSGSRLTLTALWTPAPLEPSAGVWANGSYYAPLTSFGIELPGTAETLLRAGYRQSPPVPLLLNDYAAVASLGYRYGIPIKYRYGDGYLAWERLTLEPRLRTWFDGDFGIGADLSLSADTLINYAAPVSLGVTLGYAQNFWYRINVNVGLPGNDLKPDLPSHYQ